MSRRVPLPDYRGDRLSRRAVLTRAAAVGAATALGAYVSFAPEHYPLSLRDRRGLRGMPVVEPFRLPDFRVAPAVGVAEVGMGRGGDTLLRLRKAIDAVGGIQRFVSPGETVLVKPNVAFDRAPIMGATTQPALVEALVHLVRVDARAAEVRIADNPIESPADCFAKSGIRAAAERAGGRVFLPDSNAFETLNTPGATLIEHWPFFRRPFRHVDKVIGVAPVKDHNLCHASLGLKNWYGLLGGRRNQFHQDIHTIIADLSIMIRPTLTVLDGSHVLMENGPTGGDPANVKHADVILAGTDAVAMDAWAYEHLLERRGLPQYLIDAANRGVGSTDYRGRVEEVS